MDKLRGLIGSRRAPGEPRCARRGGAPRHTRKGGQEIQFGVILVCSDNSEDEGCGAAYEGDGGASEERVGGGGRSRRVELQTR